MKTFRFIPVSLSGRLLTLLICGLLIIQTGTFYWLKNIQFQALFHGVTGDRARVVTLTYSFLAQLTPPERAAFMPKLRFFSHRFALAQDPGFENGTDEYSDIFYSRVRALSLAVIHGPDVPYRKPLPPGASEPDIRARVDRFDINWAFRFSDTLQQERREIVFAAKAAIAFDDGTWLTAEFTTLPALSGNLFGFAAALAAQFMLQVLLAFVAIRYLTTPLRQLALAADKLSPDDPECPPLPRKGPSEVLYAAKTFKAMHARIRAFVNERMSLLASLSHDLRSPVARLRVQIEKEPQLEDRRLMLDALDDLQQLMEDTINLARCGQNREPAVPLNMGSLVESVAHDYMDAGKNVRLEGNSQGCCLVRISALRRCLENLIDNALRYGKSACIRLEEDENAVRISILDDGPGIPEEHFESVFQPFYRLERSRNKTTGGTGLGLTIAQGLARLHGSEIKLANRPEGGLCVSFSLLIWQASNGGSESTAGRG